MPTPYEKAMGNSGKSFEKLIDIMATLRGPGGCPWDQEQSYQDINPYLLEEAHEVVDAIDQKDFEGLREELGDLLVHIVFFSQLAREESRFTAAEVVEGACEKMVRRHPHVFGKTKAKNTEEVLVNWEKIKAEENENKGKKRESMLEGLPKNLPALIKAFRLGEKSSRVGFDWPDQKGILKKVREELTEFEEAIEEKNKEEIEKEYGDLLFTLANVARFFKLDPETSLRKSSLSFTKRFQWIEKKAKEEKLTLQSLTPEQWNSMWEEAKKELGV